MHTPSTRARRIPSGQPLRAALVGLLTLPCLLPSGLALLASAPIATATTQQALAPPRGFNLLPNPSDAGQGGPNDLSQYFQAGGSGWTYWWAFNRDPYLAELREPGSGQIAAAALGSARPMATSLGLDQRRVHGEVVPLLQQRLSKTRDIDLAVGCLIALGKIGEAPRALAKELELVSVEASIRERLKEPNRTVRNASLLALGLVGGPRATGLLAAIVAEEPEGKKSLGGARVDRSAKIFATYGLGLVGHRTRRRSERTFIVGRLLTALEDDPEEGELGVAAVLGLSWAPLPFQLNASPGAPASGQEATLRRLLALYDGSKTNTTTRAYIPVALARLINSESGLEDPASAVPLAALRESLRLELLERLVREIAPRGGTKNPWILQGLVQAMGLLVEPRSDGPDRDAIEGLVTLGEDSFSWHSALARISLSRIAARAGVDPNSARGAIAADIITVLREDCQKGKNVHRTWASVALGIYEDAIHAAGGAPSLKTRSILQEQLKRGDSPAQTAAAAIALGLARDQELKDELIKGLETGEFMVRGLMSTSLALMDARDAQVPLRRVIKEKLVNPTFLKAASVALALFHDETLVELLVGKLSQSRFMAERVAALRGLAWCDDPGAVPALLYVVREKRIGSRVIDDKSRAFAAAALGALCSGSSIQWNSHLALDITLTATPPSLTDAREGGGVLDLF